MQFLDFFAGPFGLLRVMTNIDEVTIEGAKIDFRWKANDMSASSATATRRVDEYVGRP